MDSVVLNLKSAEESRVTDVLGVRFGMTDDGEVRGGGSVVSKTPTTKARSLSLSDPQMVRVMEALELGKDLSRFPMTLLEDALEMLRAKIASGSRMIPREWIDTLSESVGKSLKDYDYSSTQVNLPGDIARRIIAWGKANIPDELLSSTDYGGGSATDGRETDIHVTVLYGLHADGPGDVQRVVKDAALGPVTLRLGKVSVFEREDFDVVKIDVKSEGLATLNERLKALTTGEEELSPELERLLIGHISRRSSGEIVRIDNFPQLRSLLPFVTYGGDQVFATRKRVDQLDQVTVTWKRGVGTRALADAHPLTPTPRYVRHATKSIPHTSSFPVYRPHVTVAYVAKATCGHLAGDSTFDGLEVKLSALTFSGRDGTSVDIPLGDTNPHMDAFVQLVTQLVMETGKSIEACVVEISRGLPVKVSFPVEEREVREATYARDPRRLAKARRALARAQEDYTQQQTRIDQDRARRRKSAESLAVLKGGSGTIPVGEALRRFTRNGRVRDDVELEYRGEEIEEIEKRGDLFVVTTPEGQNYRLSVDGELGYFVTAFHSLTAKASQRMTLDEFVRTYMRHGLMPRGNTLWDRRGDEIENVEKLSGGDYRLIYVGGEEERASGREPVEVRLW